VCYWYRTLAVLRPFSDGFFQRKPKIGFAELRWHAQLARARASPRPWPKRIPRVERADQQRVEQPHSLWRKSQSLNTVDQGEQDIQRARKVVFQRFFHAGAMVVFVHDHSLQRA